MSVPDKINIRCSVCGFAVTTPDELVVGAYNGAPNERFDILYAPGDDDEIDFDFVTIPDGYLAYCLDDSPCECGYHPDFTADDIAAGAVYDKGINLYSKSRKICFGVCFWSNFNI